jgi:hypothetical protein
VNPAKRLECEYQYEEKLSIAVDGPSSWLMVILDGWEKKEGQKSGNRALFCSLLVPTITCSRAWSLIVYHDPQFILTLYGMRQNCPV